MLGTFLNHIKPSFTLFNTIQHYLLDFDGDQIVVILKTQVTFSIRLLRLSYSRINQKILNRGNKMLDGEEFAYILDRQVSETESKGGKLVSNF